MGLATTFLNVGNKMLNRFGTTATLTRVTQGAFSVATGAIAETRTTQTVKIIPPSPVKIGTMKDTLIQAGDVKTSLSAKGLTNPPLIGDELTINTTVYQIVHVKNQYADNTVVLYGITLRR